MPTTEQEALAESFRDCIQKTIEEHCSVVFAKDAKVEVRDIIEYASRLRVFGLEKFNDSCFISLINLFETAEDLKLNKTCGLILIFVREEMAERLFRSQLKGQEGEDEELLLDNTKLLAERIFQNFKRKAVSMGYHNLQSGKTETYLSNVEEGVPFPYDEDTLYQVNCTLWREKVLVAELVLAPSRGG